MADSGNTSSSTHTVLILVFFLIALIALLIFLYKKLNREADGEYTIRRMVYKKGGVRDRMRGAALALGTRLGVRLWPRGDTDEDGEEMQEVQDEEGQDEEGCGQGSDSKENDQEEEGNVEQGGNAKGKGDDSSDDSSSLEGSEAGEQARLMEANGEKGEKNKEKEEKVSDSEGKGEASGGPGLLIDLNQFSGSAIWSEVDGCDCYDSDVTPL